MIMTSGKQSTRKQIGNIMQIIGILLMALFLAFGLMATVIALVDIARGDGLTDNERDAVVAKCVACCTRSGFELECDVLRDRYVAIRNAQGVYSDAAHAAYVTYNQAVKVLEAYRLRTR